jgi:hypothetical protein
MSNNAKWGAAIVAFLTLLTTGLAFGEQLLNFFDSMRSAQDNNGTQTVEAPQMADITIEIAENPDAGVEATVSLNGDEVGRVYTHQEPHRITETVPEGRYNYAVVATYLGSSNASSAQYSQYSASKCPEGTRVEGNGEITISDGDRFEIYDNCAEARLEELN